MMTRAAFLTVLVLTRPMVIGLGERKREKKEEKREKKKRATTKPNYIWKLLVLEGCQVMSNFLRYQLTFSAFCRPFFFFPPVFLAFFFFGAFFFGFFSVSYFEGFFSFFEFFVFFFLSLCFFFLSVFFFFPNNK